MKIVGKRKPATGNLKSADKLQKLAIALRGKKPFHPKGVYRFTSYEELEAWNLKILRR